MRDVLLLLGMLLLAWVIPEPVHGEIYRWRDARGAIQFSDHAWTATAERVVLSPWVSYEPLPVIEPPGPETEIVEEKLPPPVSCGRRATRAGACRQR